MNANPPVAVFDADLPTGLACIRSLGRAGVPVTAYHASSMAMGRHSRYRAASAECPALHETDAFIDWLATELEAGRIGLIAPTSDFLMFNAACAVAQLDTAPDVGHPHVDAVLTSLLKHRFADSLTSIGFPTPATAAPTSFDEAKAFADAVGYPVVAKPRTHIGVGTYRGDIIRSSDELAAVFGPYELGPGHHKALAHDPALGWPLLQEFIDVPDLEVISVSGCLDRNGSALSIDHAIKQRQWPPGLGIGTLFDSWPTQPFTEHAVDAVREVLGSGIFEFEVLFDKHSGDYWGIDLNPRTFGQVSLDMSRGNDLPLQWYESVTGRTLAKQPTRSTPPTRWQLGLPLTVDLLVGIAQGPHRTRSLTDLLRMFSRSSVGAVFDRSDPLPALVFNRMFLRHPLGLIRPYLSRTPD